MYDHIDSSIWVKNIIHYFLYAIICSMYAVQNSASISAMRSRSLVLTLGCMGRDRT